jgi:hypothetical protein
MYWQKKNFYSKRNLATIVFIYSVLMVIAYNLVSYKYSGDFFMFDTTDPTTYHRYSLAMASKSFTDGINYYLTFYKYDDLGPVLIASTLYRFIESKFLLDFFYIIAGLFTALGLFRISAHFMIRKYAFICSLAYAISSYVIFYHASGRKESFMCMLIVLFFDRYYLFMKGKNFSDLIVSIFFLAGLLLFRPALILFCIISVALGLLLSLKKRRAGAILVILSFVILIALYPLFKSTYDRFLLGGDISRIQSAKEHNIPGSLRFIYIVNTLSQLVGPFTTISPDIKPRLTFLSAGMIYKILLSTLFWIGVYYIFKLQVSILYPLAFYTFLEMIGLMLVIDGMEVRKSMPHFPMIYIISFWLMDKYDLENIIKKKMTIMLMFNSSAVILFGLVFYWNLR